MFYILEIHNADEETEETSINETRISTTQKRRYGIVVTSINPHNYYTYYKGRV